MLRLVTRVMPMMAQTSAPSQLRTIYSESFLGIDFLRTKMTKEKLAIVEPGKFHQKIRSEYDENGIGNISDEDLLRIVREAYSEEDIRLAVKVSQAFAESDRPLSEDFPMLVKNALGICYMLNAVELAREMWQDKKIGPHLRTANPQLRYLTLLYNNGHYDSLADLASEENSARLSHAQWPIVMAALYKIGTREAYEIAKKSVGPILPGGNSSGNIGFKKDKNTRTKSIYAVFACKMGEHGHAYDIIGASTRPNSQAINLTAKILTDLERHEEALYYILEKISMFKPTKDFPALILNNEVISGLISSAKEKDAGNEALLSGLQGILDKVKLKDSSLEEDIMEPMTKGRPDLRRTRGPKSTMQRIDTVAPFN